MNQFEVHMGKEVIMTSNIPFGGYSRDTLLSMIQDGYKLYSGGKVLSKKAVTQLEE